MVPNSIQSHLLYLACYPKLVGHSGERGMYDTMTSELYWPCMANKIYVTVRDCCECVVNIASLKMKRHLQLLPVSVPLEFVAMEISGLRQKNQFIVFIKNRYTKITLAFLSSKCTAPYVASIFFYQLLEPYWTPAFLLT